MSDTPGISIDALITALGQMAFGAPLAVYFMKAHWDLVHKTLPKALETIRNELKAHRGEMARNADRIARAMEQCPGKQFAELHLPKKRATRPRERKTPAKKRRSPRQGG